MDDFRLDIKDMIDDVFSADLLNVKEIPRIDLYMEQITSFFDDAMADTRRKEGDKILTKTMINNYTKQEILQHPHKKRYSREHMVALTYIVMLKGILSIQDIKAFFNIAKGEGAEPNQLEPLYTVFCDVMESQMDKNAQRLEEKMDLIDNELMKNGPLDDNARLMMLITLLSYEASTYRLLAGRLIDRYENAKQQAKEQAKETKEK